MKRERVKRASSSKLSVGGGVKEKASEGRGAAPKKEKAMYEHVGRMDVRPYCEDGHSGDRTQQARHFCLFVLSRQ